MKKFTKWLKDNGFIITSEYCDTINRMRFEKDGVIYNIYPEYNGNRVIWHSIYKGNDSYRNNNKYILSGYTQKKLIEGFEKYLKEI